MLVSELSKENTKTKMQPALQEITNRINQVNNILVTVKANPSVDELAAALGLTMALNNYGKHATAVFSGQIPNAMSFLKPQKTFENNVHSLRDFIISLNKEKADKLRFAKDGEIVKIYITPYKSTITPQDLEYSEGDFNVEMVIAVGINVKEELDTVIAAHGRILHEATVATVMAGPSPSQLGSINWSDPSLTSASAMSLQLIQSLGNPALLSPEVSTALLTGVVADTDRFSNPKTSPRVMELSAQLMNAGADHQLVTSSIGAGAHLSAPTPAVAAIQPVQNVSEQSQDLVLDLHTPVAAAQIQPQPATNVSPMVNTPPEAATTQLPPQLNEIASPNPTTPISQPPITTPEQTPPAAGPTAPQAAAEEDKIKSEIDKIYSAEPFDPANNPRQDLGTNIVMPTEDNIKALGAPALSVDTTVQSTQASPALKPIMATKDESVDAGAVLGSNPVATIPGLEMPPEITPPPPPPNPLATGKTSSIDTEPFGNTVNFDPTKPAENAG